jgi:hypothetical protein
MSLGTGRRKVLGLTLVCVACAPHAATVVPQTVSGTYRGTAPDGQAVEFTFSEKDRAFQGEGRIGTQPVLIAGAVGWRGVATSVQGGAQTKLELSLSADGERLAITPDRGSPLLLSRAGGSVVLGAAGPFSGAYRASSNGATLADVTLVQRGDLLTGVGNIEGDAAGITGRVAQPGKASGLVTLLDGSQIRFEAERRADGSLLLRGFGSPIALEKRSSP